MVQRTESSINLGIGIQPDVKDQVLFNELFRVYNALRALSYALDTYTGALTPDEAEWEFIPFQSSNRQANVSRIFVEATEDIISGAVVNFYNDGSGVLKARNADADLNYIVQAFNAGGVTAGNFGQFFLPNCIHGGYSGLTTGTIYYMAATAGLITSTAPSTPGQTVQKVGYALSDTELFFCPTLEFSVVP